MAGIMNARVSHRDRAPKSSSLVFLQALGRAYLYQKVQRIIFNLWILEQRGEQRQVYAYDRIYFYHVFRAA